MDKKLSVEETINLAEKIRVELAVRRIKQADLIQPLSIKGVETATSVISLAVNGKGFQPRHQKLLLAIDEILEGGFMNEQ